MDIGVMLKDRNDPRICISIHAPIVNVEYFGDMAQLKICFNCFLWVIIKKNDKHDKI